MAPREKTVHISEQANRYLKECLRIGAIVYRTNHCMQYFTDLGTRLIFRNFVHSIQAMDLAHLLDDQLVQNVEREIEPVTPETPNTGKEEKVRTPVFTVFLLRLSGPYGCVV